MPALQSLNIPSNPLSFPHLYRLAVRDADAVSASPTNDIYTQADHEHTVGLIIGGILYALYLSCFASAIVVQRQRRLKSALVWVALGVIFFFTTAQVGVQLLEWHQAVTNATGDNPYSLWGSMTDYFSPMRSCLLVLGAITMYGILLWRLLVTWNYDRRVLIVPSLLVVTAAICAFIATLEQIRQMLSFGGAGAVTQTTWIWSLLAYLAALLCGLITTILVYSRLWWTVRRTNLKAKYTATQPQPSPVHLFFHMLIESGSLYTLTLSILIIAYGLGAHGTDSILVVVFTYVLPQILGLVPTLIILDLPASCPPITPKVFRLNSVSTTSSSSTRSSKKRNLKGPIRKLDVSWPVGIIDERTSLEGRESMFNAPRTLSPQPPRSESSSRGGRMMDRAPTPQMSEARPSLVPYNV